jgi:hypothetical protein
MTAKLIGAFYSFAVPLHDHIVLLQSGFGGAALVDDSRHQSAALVAQLKTIGALSRDFAQVNAKKTAILKPNAAWAVGAVLIVIKGRAIARERDRAASQQQR